MHGLPEFSLLVTADVIKSYAELTEDFNPLHIDPDFAAGTSMGTVIAHGTMSISLIWQSLAAAFGPDALERVDLDIRFVKPVRVGETLTSGGRQGDAGEAAYDVWVRGDDGDERLAGTAVLRGDTA